MTFPPALMPKAGLSTLGPAAAFEKRTHPPYASIKWAVSGPLAIQFDVVSAVSAQRVANTAHAARSQETLHNFWEGQSIARSNAKERGPATPVATSSMSRAGRLSVRVRVIVVVIVVMMRL